MKYNHENKTSQAITVSAPLAVIDMTQYTSFAVQITVSDALALNSCVVKMQESVDGSNWFDIASVNSNITGNGSILLQSTSKCGQIRPYITLVAGTLTATVKVNTKE